MPWPGAIRAFFVKGCFGKTLHFLCRPAPGGTFSLFARPGHQKTYPLSPLPTLPGHPRAGDERGGRERERKIFLLIFFPFFSRFIAHPCMSRTCRRPPGPPVFFDPDQHLKNKRQKTFSHGEKIISICLSAFFWINPTD